MSKELINDTLFLITSLFAIVGGLFGFYKIFIKPKRIKTKLFELLKMTEEWFDELDSNLERNLNTALLNNKENKIREYIETHLKTYKIKPKKKLIRKWNKKMGIKAELQRSSDIFQKYSHIPVSGIYIDMFFRMIVSNFYKFHSAYNSENKQECNFADIEMPVKFLKFYVENL